MRYRYGLRAAAELRITASRSINCAFTLVSFVDCSALTAGVIGFYPAFSFGRPCCWGKRSCSTSYYIPCAENLV